jgi:folate-binding protein YgfZ
MSISADVNLSAGAAALGVLAFRGIDTARFLQGQLSADMEKLAVGASTLAGFHNPQGRVIALLGVVRTTAEEFLAVLPRELAMPVAQRLGKFILRAKVRIADESESLRVFGVAGASTDARAVTWGDRQFTLRPVSTAEIEPDVFAVAAWLRADISAGLPQIHAATSEAFVAQMLNLDLLGAIAFDKGCYTGQEVIARAHYRGRVKRRMQRWLNIGATSLRPGDAARAPDGRALTVVSVAPEAGGQAVLAVGNFTPAAASGESEAAPGGAPQVSGPLPLPYALPE